MLRSKTLIRAAAAAILAGLVAGGAPRAQADDQDSPAGSADLQDRMSEMERSMRSMQQTIDPLQRMMGQMQQMMGQMQQMMGTMQQMMGRRMSMMGRGGPDIDIEGNTITMGRRHWGGVGPGMAMGMGGPDDPATQTLRRSVMAMHLGMPRRLSGDPDRDFATVMVPHHQGAIDMANLELQFGKDEDLKKLAQAIVKAQSDELALLKAWLAKNPGK
jgi:uncharacterized protein (DUF305 family)